MTKAEQPQQPGSGEMIIAKIEEVIEESSELWHSGVINRIASAVYNKIYLPLERELEETRTVKKAYAAHIHQLNDRNSELEQQLSDKDKEIAELKAAIT